MKKGNKQCGTITASKYSSWNCSMDLCSMRDCVGIPSDLTVSVVNKICCLIRKSISSRHVRWISKSTGSQRRTGIIRLCPLAADAKEFASSWKPCQQADRFNWSWTPFDFSNYCKKYCNCSRSEFVRDWTRKELVVASKAVQRVARNSVEVHPQQRSGWSQHDFSCSFLDHPLFHTRAYLLVDGSEFLGMVHVDTPNRLITVRKETTQAWTASSLLWNLFASFETAKRSPLPITKLLQVMHWRYSAVSVEQ